MKDWTKWSFKMFEENEETAQHWLVNIFKAEISWDLQDFEMDTSLDSVNNLQQEHYKKQRPQNTA